MCPDRDRNGGAAAQKDANTPASSVRPPSTSTQLKAWHILRKLRCCPWRAAQFAEANHLQTREIAGWKFWDAKVRFAPVSGLGPR